MSMTSETYCQLGCPWTEIEPGDRRKKRCGWWGDRLRRSGTTKRLARLPECIKEGVPKRDNSDPSSLEVQLSPTPSQERKAATRKRKLEVMQSTLHRCFSCDHFEAGQCAVRKGPPVTVRADGQGFCNLHPKALQIALFEPKPEDPANDPNRTSHQSA